jgi:hypothetical protein
MGRVVEIRGALTGPNGVALPVVTIWMKETQTARRNSSRFSRTKRFEL